MEDERKKTPLLGCLGAALLVAVTVPLLWLAASAWFERAGKGGAYGCGGSILLAVVGVVLGVVVF